MSELEAPFKDEWDDLGVPEDNEREPEDAEAAHDG